MCCGLPYAIYFVQKISLLRFQNPLLHKKISLCEAQLINKGEAIVVYRTSVAAEENQGKAGESEKGTEEAKGNLGANGLRDETVQRIGESLAPKLIWNWPHRATAIVQRMSNL